MTVLILPDKHLSVTDEGAGDPVVMLHGLGGTTSAYQPQAEALSATHRVVRIDLPGSGRSLHAGPLSIRSWADDVLAALTALGIERACLVAHSLGTLVAADLAARHPLRVRSLVGLGPVRAQPDEVKAATRERARVVREGGMEQVVDGVLAVAVPDRVRGEKPLVAALVRESLLGQDPAGYAASCEALADAGEPDWAQVTVPTWFLGGADDQLAPPEVVGAIARRVPHAGHETAPGAGHWLSVEEPGLVTGTVRKGLAA